MFYVEDIVASTEQPGQLACSEINEELREHKMRLVIEIECVSDIGAER